MRKLMSFVFAGVTAVILSGCGGGGSSYNDGLTTLFLVDHEGYAYSGVPYQCDSMLNPSVTAYNGEFSFYPGEDCTFDFYGLNGTDPDDIYENDYVYIVDDRDHGKNGIEYQCEYFNVGNINSTYDDGIRDGSFDYDYDDRCEFYL